MEHDRMAAKISSKQKAAKKKAKKKTPAKRPAKKKAKKKAAKTEHNVKAGRGHKRRSTGKPAETQQLPFEGGATQVDMLYPAGTIADMLGITDRHLRRLVTEGIVPKATHGRYPLRGCVHGYVRYLQALRVSTDEHSGEKTRLSKVRADTYELELAEKRGELYRREVIDEALFSACTTLTAMLDGSASRIASQLGGGAVLRKRLLDAFREIRTEYAAGLRAFSERLQQDGWDRRPSTRHRTRPVVKKKSTAKRKS